MTDQPRNARTRTHLANERTFLAWVRTGVTTIALGVAATQLLDREAAVGPLSLATLLAGTLMVFGLAVTLVGWQRYRDTTSAIESGDRCPGSRGLDVTVVGVAAVSVVAMLVVLQTA